MKNQVELEIEKRLSGVLPGTFHLEKNQFQSKIPPFFASSLTAQSEGKGSVKAFDIFPGIELSFHEYLADSVSFDHDAKSHVMEINYCKNGRIGWKMKDGLTAYLGSGDLSIHTIDCCAESKIDMPLGYYEGISLSVDLQVLNRHIPDLLKEAAFDPDVFLEKFCKDKRIAALPSDNHIINIFTFFPEIPENLLIPYWKLKVQELLLYLMAIPAMPKKESSQYKVEQVAVIQKIHEQLTHQLNRRFTIDELSRQYLMNTSSLKAVFKTVYGLPIALYMKEFRMKEAAKLLRETPDSIAAISRCLGYENQSKFTAAFKDIFQILPSEYRRQYDIK